MKAAVLLAILFMFTSYARAEVVLLDKDGFKFSFSGFIEADAEHDTTRSYTEILGNHAVAAPGTNAGDNGRTQFSIRNSRFAFKLVTPEVAEWKTLGYLEYDLLGYDGGGNVSENATYTNPNLRLRHGYIQTEKNGWQITAGQTWDLLGWQPYYFEQSVDIMPLPGMLYARTEQLRGMKTIAIGEKGKLEIAAAILRPPQEDSSMPDFQAGVRYSTTALQSGASGSSTAPRMLMPMSVAVSGAYRQFAIQDAAGTDTTHYDGYAVVADAMIPIIPSRDGNISNTLALFGEFTFGAGDGDQFNQWTGNGIGTGSTAIAGTYNATRKTNLDAGLGDYDSNGNFALEKLTTFNVHAQYQLPNNMPDFIDVGYSQLFSGNMNSLTQTEGGNKLSSAGTQPYNRVRGIFGNWFHDFTPSLRAGFEYVYTDTAYKTGNGHNNRYQLSGFFFF